MKFKFENQEAIRLPLPSGTFTTGGAADVYYEFEDDYIYLTIRGFVFGTESISELIDFLKAAQEKLK